MTAPKLPRLRILAFLAAALLAGPLAAAPLGVNADLLSGGLQHLYILETDRDREAFQVDLSIRIQRSQFALPANVTFRYRVSLESPQLARPITTSLTETVQVNGFHDEIINPVVELDPAVQIDGAYTLRMEVFHVEDPSSPGVFTSDDSGTLFYLYLVSFSGELKAGPAAGTINELSDAPPPHFDGGSDWTIRIAEGTLSSGLSFMNTADSDASIGVRRLANGDLVVISGSAEVDDGDGIFAWGESTGRRKNPALVLANGIEIPGFTLDLPPGLGWRDGSKGLLRSRFDSGDLQTPLNADMSFLGTVSAPFRNVREFISETLAVAFTPPSFSFDGTTFTLAQPGTRFLHQQRYQRHFSIKGELPKANDGYLYFLTSPAVGDLTVNPGANGGISVVLDIGNGFYSTHLPEAQVDGTGATVRIANNNIDPGSSFAANWIRLQYEQGCPGLGTGQKQGMRILNPAISMTPAGGLVASGALATPAQFPGTERHLVAGLNEDGNAVHATDSFTNAEFYAPGFSLPGEDASVTPNPARFVLAETQPANDFALGYPGSPAYAAGQGLYAGFNFFHFPGLQATSRVAGETPIAYDLLTNAKFYNRCSGVSGIIEADSGALPFNITAYGFPISFTDWGFNLLSNEMLESDIEGLVDLTGTHAGFVQAMEEVRINCCGNLEDFLVPPGTDPTHQLAYWFGSEFSYSAVRFETPAACADDRAALSYAANAAVNGLPGEKAGYLRFLKDGSMTIPDDADFEASTLALQPQGGVHGQYYLWPLSDAYFNNPASNPSPGAGFVTFHGDLDVAFFNDMRVRGFTAATPNLDAELLVHFLHGDFLADGAIDATHFGLPGVMEPADYRDDESRLPHARGSFFGQRDTFDFPVTFDPPTGNFYSREDLGSDLIILETEGGVDRLNAKLAQIHFGLTINGLVQMTVGNLLEAATSYGVQGLAGVIGDQLTAPIKDGLLGLAETLDNRLENLLADALAQAVDPVITAPLAQQIQALGPGWNGNGPALDAVLLPYFGNPGNFADGGLLQGALASFHQFDDGVGQVAGIAEEIRERLEKLQQALDCSVALLGGQIGEHQNAALSGIFEFFVGQLETNPDVGQISGTQGYDDALDSLIDSADLGWLADARDALVRLRDTVGGMIEALETGQEFFQEIQNVFGDATQVVRSVTDARNQIRNRVILDMAGQVDEFTLEEIELVINSAIRDHFFDSVLSVNLQSLLRARLGYLDSAVQAALTTALQALQDAILEILLDSPALSAVQDAIAAAQDLLGMLSIIKSISLQGEAFTCDDRIRQLCLQAGVDFGIPTPAGITIPMEVDALFKFVERESDGSNSCLAPRGAILPEITLAASGGTAIGFGLDSSVQVALKFNMNEDYAPTGFSGNIEVDQGDFAVAAMGINRLSATLALSGASPGQLDEYYLAAFARGNFGVGPLTAELEGGFAIGTICNDAPFSFYPNFPHLPGGSPVTGIAAYMTGKAPLVGGGCLYNVTLGLGAGGYVILGDGAGGILEGSLSGEVLCLAKAEGSFNLQYDYIPAAPEEPGTDPNYQNATHRFFGSAEAKIRLGRKPFAIEKKKSIGLQYTKTRGQNGDWDVNP